VLRHWPSFDDLKYAASMARGFSLCATEFPTYGAFSVATGIPVYFYGPASPGSAARTRTTISARLDYQGSSDGRGPSRAASLNGRPGKDTRIYDTIGKLTEFLAHTGWTRPVKHV
jgi:hypothetical protein